MRSLYIYLFLLFHVALQTAAQEPVNGFEFKYSMIRPVRQHDNYSFSADPTFEAFYLTTVSKRVIVSGGLMIQAGKQSWEQWANHTLFPEVGTPFPLKGMYDRKFRYLCAGLPLKLERSTNGGFLSSIYTEFTAGRYLKIDLEDYYNSKLIKESDVKYHGLFWDIQLGVVKDFHKTNTLAVALSAMAGIRHQCIDELWTVTNLTEYVYYGLGISVRLRK